MWEQGFVLAILIGTMVSLIVTRIQPSLIFGGAAFIAFMSGMLDLPAVADNFTNPSLFTLVLLILASTALEKTRLVGWVSHSLSHGKLAVVIAKLGLSTALLSSFTNNTAVVVSLIGAIKRNQKHPPSKLLLPLSYAAILGGTLTLIGTSTNLIINSFVENVGLPGMTFFTPTLIGLSVLTGGVLVLIPLSYFLPSDDEQRHDDLPYFLEAKVDADSPLVGRTISENNLRALRKLFLAEVIRNGESVPSVEPDFVLQAHDRLLFCGDIESVSTLQEIPGLSLFGQHHLNGQHLIEAVVSTSASFCNNTLKSVRFRERYDAVVIAVRRGFEQLEGGLGNMTLMAGDTLVLVPGKQFDHRRRYYRKDFVILNELDSSAKLDRCKSHCVLLGFLVVIGLAVLNWLPIIKGLSVYLLFLLLSGVVHLNELRRRFPVDLVVIVGSALSMAQLMMSSGVSQYMGMIVIHHFEHLGVYGAMIGTYLMTLILTELVTNNAAAALAFPIGYSMAMAYGVDPMPFIMAVMFGASASFISPYSYQTNLLVYRVGHYTFGDYLKLGGPISLVYSGLVITLIPYFFPF